MSKTNPWDVIALRRKIKRYDKTGFTEAMNNLSKLRSLNLDKDMLIGTEVTRTLIWVSNRTMDCGEDQNKRNFNKMVRFLIK
jgi:hypothetical protein